MTGERQRFDPLSL